eukprot:1137632_1
MSMIKLVILFKHVRRGFSSSAQRMERRLELNIKNVKYQVLHAKCKQQYMERIKPIVLLPAAGQKLNQYKWFMNYLSQYSDVIIIGHCTTPNKYMDNPIDIYKSNAKDFKVDIECIKNTLNHLKLKEANFVGISYGAICLYSFANAYPSMVNTMHLSSIGTFMSDRCAANFEKWKKCYYNHSNDDHYYENLAGILSEQFADDKRKQRATTRYFLSLLKSSPNSVHQLHYFFERSLDKGCGICAAEKKSNEIQNIKTELIRAESDPLYSYESVKYLQKIIGINCNLSQVKGGHLWQHESKSSQNVFCSQVADFIVQSTTEDVVMDDVFAKITNE